MIRTATIFRHMLDNGPGTIETVLKKRGVELTMIDTFAEPLDGFDPLATDLLIVLGGACGVYQSRLYPFMEEEIVILAKRLAADRPTLGICLGAQMMAAALDAPVYKGLQGSEIGWYPLRLTPAGMDSPARHFDAAATQVMQWHGDTFDLPDGVTLLAGSDKYPHHIFRSGQNGYAVQGHIEIDRKTVRSWLVSDAYEIGNGHLDLHRIQSDTEKYTPVLAGQTEKFLNEWLDRVKI